MRNAARLIPLLMISLLLLAWTGTPTDTIITVEYDEPTTNTDGSAVVLTKTSIYWKIGTGIETRIDVPASRPQGGTHMVRQVNVPIAPNQGGTVTAQVTASNATSESSRSNAAILPIDRKSPAVPANFKVR